jgi:hypothetical protein
MIHRGMLAKGIGELIPGTSFVVPQNPISDAVTMMAVPTESVAGVGTEVVSMGTVKRKARLGELLQAQFVVPHNPIVNNFTTGMGGLAGLGCGPDCTGGFTGSLAGLGSIDLSEYYPSNWTTTEWAIAGGALLVLLLMFRPGGSDYRAEVARARADYQARVAGARGKYARVGSRAYRALSAGAAAA